MLRAYNSGQNSGNAPAFSRSVGARFPFPTSAALLHPYWVHKTLVPTQFLHRKKSSVRSNNALEGAFLDGCSFCGARFVSNACACTVLMVFVD